MRLNALAVTAGFAVMFASAYPAVNGEAVIIAPEAHGFLHARQGVEIFDLTAGFSLRKQTPRGSANQEAPAFRPESDH